MGVADRLRSLTGNGEQLPVAEDPEAVIIDLPSRQEETQERKEVDGVKTMHTLLELGTRDGVTMYRSKDNPSVVEFRWHKDRRTNIFRVEFADVKYVKISV